MGTASRVDYGNHPYRVYFNPLAKSGAGAYGLMQVIPKYAGREAYQYLYHEDRSVRPDYLYNADNNIRIGSTYLHLLLSEYFSNIKDLTKRKYLTICSYNWGPTAMRKKVLDAYNIHTMSAHELYRLLRHTTPKETSNYLEKVTDRTRSYAQFF